LADAIRQTPAHVVQGEVREGMVGDVRHAGITRLACC
jgi:hypothetical protein